MERGEAAQFRATNDQTRAVPAGQSARRRVTFKIRPAREAFAWFISASAISAMLLIILLPHPDDTKNFMSVRDAALRGAIWQSVSNNPAASANGFYLTSARTDIVAGHLTQILAYGGAEKPITLCIWPADGQPAHGVRNVVFEGMAIAYWNDGNEEFWAATTGPASLLVSFMAAIRDS